MAADPAGERGQHMGKFDIELGGFEHALGLQARRIGGLQGLAALVDDGVGDRLGLVQHQRAVEFALGELSLGAGVGQLAIGLLGNGLERAGIDGVEQVAGLDEGAIAEFDAGDKAADTGANLDFLDRLEPAGEFIPIGDEALDRLRDRDRIGGAAACGAGFSLQPDSAMASKAVDKPRRRRAWRGPSMVRDNFPDPSAAPNCISPRIS